MRLYRIADPHSPKIEPGYRIISAKIDHEVFRFAKAKVIVDNEIEDTSGYFALMDQGSRIFLGVIESYNNNEYDLVAIPQDLEEQKTIIFRKNTSGNLLNRAKALKCDLINWDCGTLIGKHWNDIEESSFRQVSDGIYNAKLDSNQGNAGVQLKVNIKWCCTYPEVIDVGSQVFAGGSIETFTPKSLTGAWPKEGTVFRGLYVAQSRIRAQTADWVKAGRKSYLERVKLSGSLLLQRFSRIDYHESWELAVGDQSVSGPKIDLYLDLSELLGNYPVWEANIGYLRGEKVLFESEGSYQLKLCLVDHVSKAEPVEEQWKDLGTKSYLASEKYLFESPVGQEVFNELMDHVAPYLMVKRPTKVLRLKLEWEKFAQIGVAEAIRWQVDGEWLDFRIIKVIKYYDFKNAVVELVCARWGASSGAEQRPGRWSMDLSGAGKIIEIGEISCEEAPQMQSIVQVHNLADEQFEPGMKSTFITLSLPGNRRVVKNTVRATCEIRGVA